MTSPLDLLDTHPGPGVDTLGTPWWHQVEDSLLARPADWVAAVDELGVARAWVLLGWARKAAEDPQRQETLDAAVFVLALLWDGPLDRRDVMVVGPMVHGAAVLARMDFGAAVVRGCGPVGFRAAAAAEWLERTPARPLRGATLRVMRPPVENADAYDRHAAFVWIDGQKVGQLRPGERLERLVRSGQHTVRVRLRFNPNARTASLEVADGDVADVVCAKDFPAYRAFPPSRYWRLSVELVSGSPPVRD